MGEKVMGWDRSRNASGAIAHAGQTGELLEFSQLLLNWELWGVDARIVNRRFCEHEGRFFIRSHFVEKDFCDALQNYMNFFRAAIPESKEWVIEAGLTGVRHYGVVVSNRVRGLITMRKFFGGRRLQTQTFRLI